VPGFTVQNYVSGIPKPYRLAFSPDGVLYVGNNTNVAPEWADRVPVGGDSFSPYGTTPYSDPDAVAFDETGSVSGTPWSLIVGRGLSGGTGSLIAVLPNQSVVDIEASSLLGNPDDLVLDRTGRMLITDFSGGKSVLAKSGLGNSSVLFTTPTRPVTIAVDANNNIYTSADDGDISVHTPTGMLLNPAFLTGLPDAPLDFGPGGCWGTDLYTVNNTTHELLRVAPNGVASVIGTGFGQVVDIAFSPDSLLYLSMYNDSTVLRVSPSPPSPFTLLTPADMDTLSTWRVFLDWADAAVPACPGGVSYYIDTDTTNEFSSFRYRTQGPRSSSQDTVVVEFVPGRTYYWRVMALDTHGGSTWATPGFRSFVTYAGGYPSAVESGTQDPPEFTIRSCSPNPFARNTQLNYVLPERRKVVALIMDVSGRVVRTIELGEMERGNHQLEWDGQTNRGGRAGAGMYFALIRAGREERSVKLLLLR